MFLLKQYIYIFVICINYLTEDMKNILLNNFFTQTLINYYSSLELSTNLEIEIQVPGEKFMG